MANEHSGDQANQHPGTELALVILKWLAGIGAVLAAAAIMGVCGAVYGKLQSQEQSQAELKNQITGIQHDVQWIKLGMTDIYTEKQADKAHAEIKRTTDDLYGRWRSQEQRIKVLEQKIQ